MGLRGSLITSHTAAPALGLGVGGLAALDFLTSASARCAAYTAPSTVEMLTETFEMTLFTAVSCRRCLPPACEARISMPVVLPRAICTALMRASQGASRSRLGVLWRCFALLDTALCCASQVQVRGSRVGGPRRTEAQQLRGACNSNPHGPSWATSKQCDNRQFAWLLNY